MRISWPASTSARAPRFITPRSHRPHRRFSSAKYRKVYLPREEIGSRLDAPAMDYPVFRTDFGKVGMMILLGFCSMPIRRVRSPCAAAEMIVLPIWGVQPKRWSQRAPAPFVAPAFRCHPNYGPPVIYWPAARAARAGSAYCKSHRSSCPLCRNRVRKTGIVNCGVKAGFRISSRGGTLSIFAVETPVRSMRRRCYKIAAPSGS